MRAFVRLFSSERVLTLDLPPSTTIRALKEAVIESGQLPAGSPPADGFTVRLHSRSLPDDAALEACMSSTQCTNALHVALVRAQVPSAAVTCCSPEPGTCRAPLDAAICCTVPGVASVADPSAAIEVRGWMDQHVSGRASFDAATRVLRFEPEDPLLPERTYVAVVRAAAAGEAAWQFRTVSLAPVRVIVALASSRKRPLEASDEASDERRLVTLQRREAPLAELQAAVRSAFEVPNEEHRFSLIGGADLDASGVTRLREGEVVHCTTLRPADQTVRVHSDAQALSHAEYRREHYVNSPSGYFAVCGKLTPPEEHELLLAVVAAFETDAPPMPPGPPEPFAAATGIPASSVSSCRADAAEVSPELIAKRWGGPDAPRCCSLHRPAELLAEWRRSGFAVVALPPQARSAVEVLRSEWASFCALPIESKQAGAARQYLGYHYRPHFCKELFQLRGGADAAAAFPPAAAALRRSAERAYDALAAVAADAVGVACGAMGMAAELATSLLEPPLAEQASRAALSQSNLTLFRYSPSLGAAGEVARDVHCPYHTDVGLATLIPLGASPGLHVFDHTPGREGWVDIEAGAPEGLALLFGGETLHRLSNHWMLPAVHQVAHVAAERLSCPLQLLAAAEAQLDSRLLDRSTVGPLLAECASPVTAGEHVARVSASRVSSNFPRVSV